MKKLKIDTGKTVAKVYSVLLGGCASVVVEKVIVNVVPMPDSTIGKIAVGIGSISISGLVYDKVSQKAYDEMISIADAVNVSIKATQEN